MAFLKEKKSLVRAPNGQGPCNSIHLSLESQNPKTSGNLNIIIQNWEHEGHKVQQENSTGKRDNERLKRDGSRNELSSDFTEKKFFNY